MAQFIVTEHTYEETFWLDEYDELTEVSKILSVSSTTNPESAKKINNTIFRKLFHSSFDDMLSFDSLFPVRDEHSSKHMFSYEILENSDRFLTIHFSYQRPYADRSHRYYTFVSATGEIKEMFDLITEEAFYTIANMVFPIYAKELDTYINSLDTSNVSIKEQYDVLVECADNYFEEEYRFEYGYIYLLTDGLHCINPPCPDQNWVTLDRKEWFTCSFSYDEFKGLLTDRMIAYAKTGVWEYTFEELLFKAPMYEGTINGNKAELRIVEKDGELIGDLYEVSSDIGLVIKVTMDKKKFFMKPLDSDTLASKLKLKDGILTGTFNFSETESWELNFNYSPEN
ncbi:MAG: hypothetical protein IH946_04080 [Bacteroidetes bacterium]|nr:hypothetical protein [Bacteroidota bacterium]